MEWRYNPLAECRILNDDSAERQVIGGYAAVFYNPNDPGTEYELPNWGEGRMVERIARTAFDRALREGDDVRALFNHDTSNVLGRTASRTLRLSVDERGLRYEIDLPETQLAKDLRIQIKRGDISGSSFAFIATETNWQRGDDITIREVRGVELYDVGPVTYPAYEASTAFSRSADEAKREYEAWRYLTREQDAAEGEDRCVQEMARAYWNRIRAICVEP